MVSKPVHYDHDLWDEPKAFNPDRFLIEKTKQRNPFSFIPFSGGPRNCIGKLISIISEFLSLSRTEEASW